MLSNYVGEDVFLKGVSIYLKKHLYGNSVTNDLWSGVAEASGIDVPKVMNNWVTKVRASPHTKGKCPKLTPRLAIRSLKLPKWRVGSASAKTGSLSLVLLRNRITKPSGTSLDHRDRSKLVKLWCCRTVPLAILSVGKDGKRKIDNSLILDTREKTIPLDTTKPYKINANTTGVCMSSVVVHPPILSLTSPDRSRALQP